MARREEISWMWPEACAMIARAERLHRQFFHVGASGAHQTIWEPPVDVLETPEHVLIVVGLPGVDPGSVGAAIEADSLVVAGDRSLPRELGGAYIHRMELPQGRFERRVLLPAGRYGNARSTNVNGCLIVTLSKLS
jgi:HSP20 family protein